MNNTVEVRIDGKRFGGWESVRIECSIDQVARGFAMRVTEKFPGQTDYRVFQTGGLVQVFIGSDLVCTGYITSVPVKYDGKSVSIEIQGKSRTVDLVDCCPPAAAVSGTAQSQTWVGVKGKSGNALKVPAQPANSWKNLPASQIIAALAKPYGITVRDDAGIGGKLANHTVNPGETVIQSINRLITKDNLVVTDDENGNLVLTQPGAAGACADSVRLGVNVLAGSASFDLSKRFSDYVVLGQHKGTDNDFGKSVAEDKGTASDPGVNRYRLKVIKDSGQSSGKTCSERADFEARYNRAQSRRGTFTLQGWRQSDGNLWKCNGLVSVFDEIFHLDARMCIAKIIYELAAGGMKTSLEVVPSDGYRRNGAGISSEGSSQKWDGVSKD